MLWNKRKMSVVTIDLSDESNDFDDLPELDLETNYGSQQTISLSNSASQSSEIRVAPGEGNAKTTKQKGVKRKNPTEQQMAKAAQKIYKPGECMKYMVIDMHPNLLDMWYCADVPREVSITGAKIKPNSSLCDVRLVLWSRLVEPTLDIHHGIIGLTPTQERSTHGLYITTLEDIEEYIKSHSLSQRMLSAAELAGCKLTLVLFAVKDYFKKASRPNNNMARIEPIDLEMALTDLLVTADCDAITVNTPNELALTVVQFTKAIAEAPYKKAKRVYDEQADFYMRGDNKNCVAVSKNGDGVGALWQQMLAVLPHSSLEIARAICKQYPTPKSLYEALQHPSGEAALANIGVARSAASGSKARRVGNEFARKLRLILTGDAQEAVQ